MARTYKLNYFTKGTGATVEPIDGGDDTSAEDRRAVRRRLKREQPKSRGAVNEPPDRGAASGTREGPAEKRSTPLPPGHVRKKLTGEIGRVQSIDAKAGTATVFWLRQGRASTVPLATVSRR